MQVVIIGTKNQIVIPKEIRKKIPELKPGRKVIVDSPRSDTVTIRPAASNWVEQSYGIMKDAWKNIDPIRELEKSRDEWDEKLKEYEKVLSKS